MTTADLIQEIKRLGLTLHFDGADLKCRGTVDPIPEELVLALRERRQEILCHVIDDLEPGHLRGIDREYYGDLFDLMTGPSHKLDPKQAESKAMQLVKKSMKKLYAKEQ